MKPLALTLAILAAAAVTGVAHAGPDCSGAKPHQQSAEAPPPPPVPAPST